MKTIIINFVPAEAGTRLGEIGDWFFSEDGNLHINVTDLNDWRYNVLFARHELDEAILCKQNGISTQEVDQDQVTRISEEDDPDSLSGYPDSPIQIQHNDALAFEWLFSRLLGVDWDDYSLAVDDAEEELKSYGKNKDYQAESRQSEESAQTTNSGEES
jgi:hypothetical protein